MFKVAIPSYNRAEILMESTLKTLKNANINEKYIDVWVTSENEKKEYENVIDSDFYNNIYVGLKGKAKQINLIRKFYPNGTKLLNIDDDILNIKYVKGNKLEEVNDIYKYSKMIFKLMKKYKTGLGGVYYPENPLFMANKINFNFYNIIGGLYWTLNSNDSKLNVYEKCCEDLEFSIKNYLKYGKLLRSWELCIFDKSRYDKNTDRLASNVELSMVHMKFVNKYPNLLKKYESKDGLISKAIKQKNHESIKLKERVI